jgi:hypothetical protein
LALVAEVLPEDHESVLTVVRRGNTKIEGKHRRFVTRFLPELDCTMNVRCLMRSRRLNGAPGTKVNGCSWPIG